jgi:hypothetical protein
MSTTLKDIDFQTIDLRALEKLAQQETALQLRERVNMLSRFRKTMQMPPLATPAECQDIRQALIKKENLLASIIRKKELEEKQQQDRQDATFSEKTAKKHIHEDKDVRICYDSVIPRMQALGTEHVPTNSTQWLRPSSTEIEIPCQSGKVRKFDLTKIPVSLWRQLEQNKLAPVFFTVEAGGMIDEKGNSVPVWSNQKDYSVVTKQRQVSATVMALMVV